MFKNFLTYNFALSFHQLCSLVEFTEAQKSGLIKERLDRSAQQMLVAFTKVIHSKNAKEMSPHLFSSIVNLRECKDILVQYDKFSGDLAIKYEILHARLEQIAEKVALEQGGQMSMIG